MTRINREQFKNEFQTGINIDTLSKGTIQALENAGISGAKLNEIAHGDGKIEGSELQQLFDAVDKFDNERTDGYIDTEMKLPGGFISVPTAEGEAYKALKAEFDRNLTKARVQGSNDSKLPLKQAANKDDSLPRVNNDTLSNITNANIQLITERDIAAAVSNKQITTEQLQKFVEKATEKDPHWFSRTAWQVSNDKNESVRSSFLDATMKVYDKQIKDAPAAASLATGAAEIIGKESKEQQLLFLSKLNKNNTLEEFIKNGTSFEIWNKPESRGEGFDKSLMNTVNSGVPNLVKTIADAGIQDSRSAPLTIPLKDLEDIRLKMFNSAATIYSDPKRLPIWTNRLQSKDTTLKDGLSSIFRQDFDRIWKSGIAAKGPVFDTKTQATLEGFFQHVLFTKPTGTQRDATSKFLSEHMKEWLVDINNPKLSDKDFEEKYSLDKDHRIDRTKLTHLMGATMGFVNNSIQAAVTDAKDREAARKAARSTVLDFVLDMGLSLVPGGGAVSKALDLEGAKVINHVFENLSDEVIKKLKDMSKQEAKEFLMENYPDFQPDAALNQLFQELRENTQGDNEKDLLSALDSGYSVTDLRSAVKDK